MDNYILSKSYNFYGTWWAPKNNIKFSGELKYSPNFDYSTLILWGNDNIDNIDFDNDVIVGHTSLNKFITITRILKHFSKYNVQDDSKYHHEFHIYGPIIIGKHYDNYSNISFKQLRVSFTNQIDFIQKNGFEADNDNLSNTIKYIYLDRIKVYDDKEVSIELGFNCNFGYPSKTTQRMVIEQKEKFIIKSNQQNNTYNYFRTEMMLLRNFITLSINKRIYIEELIINDDYERSKDIFVLENNLSLQFDDKETESSMLEIMINLDEIISNKSIYKNWKNIYLTNKSSIDTFYSLLYKKNDYVENDFLTLVNIFESYYRNSIAYKRFNESPEIFEGKVNKLYEQCSHEYHALLKKALKHSNELNLATRFHFITNKFKDVLFYLVEKGNKRNTIVDRISATRNYLIHKNINSKKLDIIETKDLSKYNNYLYVLITILFLNDLAYSIPDIIDKMYKNPTFTTWIILKMDKQI